MSPEEEYLFIVSSLSNENHFFARSFWKLKFPISKIIVHHPSNFGMEAHVTDRKLQPFVSGIFFLDS